MSPNTESRIDEIDWLKGFAILCVLLIHAKPLAGTLLHTYVVDRAVPIFFVLFGVTSETWWRSRESESPRLLLGKWMVTRLPRLVVPLWAAASVWWVMAFLYSKTAVFSWLAITATYLGYSPWIGISWFVTVILQLVAIFPLLRWCTVRAGPVVSLAAAAAVSLASLAFLPNIVGAMRSVLGGMSPAVGGLYYFWIFSPAYLWHVVGGIWLARCGPLVEPRWFVGCAAVYVACVVFHGLAVDAPRLGLSALRLGEVPLTAGLLFLIQALRRWPAVAALLGWCGAISWGLYLGHMLVHEAFHMFGLWPELGALGDRWAYFVSLLVGGIGLVALGERLRERAPADWLPKLRVSA